MRDCTCSRGCAYQDAELNDDAEREYKAAIEKNAKGSRGHYFLGLFYLEKNGWAPTPEAREQFLAEVAVNPADFFGNYFMGYLMSEEQRVPSVRPLLESRGRGQTGLA